jgi:hypothetical protein
VYSLILGTMILIGFVTYSTCQFVAWRKKSRLSQETQIKDGNTKAVDYKATGGVEDRSRVTLPCALSPAASAAPAPKPSSSFSKQEEREQKVWGEVYVYTEDKDTAEDSTGGIQEISNKSRMDEKKSRFLKALIEEE